jgi:hypothetical protein
MTIGGVGVHSQGPGPPARHEVPASSACTTFAHVSPVERGSFLEIELAARRGEKHRTCGGRTLNDDVMDRLFTLLIAGGNGPAIRDGVDRSSRPASQTFPYLAAPNTDPPQPPQP